MKLKSFNQYHSSILHNSGILFLRIAFGALMIFGHGMAKYKLLTGESDIQFVDPFGIGLTGSLILVIFAEIVCSAFLILGLFTRLALIPLIITMLFALLMIHWNDPFHHQEKALLFLSVYLALFMTGPGKFSLDYFFRTK